MMMKQNNAILTFQTPSFFTGHSQHIEPQLSKLHWPESTLNFNKGAPLAPPSPLEALSSFKSSSFGHLGREEHNEENVPNINEVKDFVNGLKSRISDEVINMQMVCKLCLQCLRGQVSCVK